MGKRKHEEPENTERWLLTYADMITLLMAFFILMYTMSRVDSQKLAGIAANLKDRLGAPRSMFPGKTPGDLNIIFQSKGDKAIAPPLVSSPRLVADTPRLNLKNIKTTLHRNSLDQMIKLRVDERGLVISLMTDGILFDIQSSQLKPQAQTVLDQVGYIIESITNKISIEGHTDELRYLSKSDPSVNWNLSAGRALAVLNYLVQKKFVSEERCQISAFSANRPVGQHIKNEDERRRLNRRVDIVIFGKAPGLTRGEPTGELTLEDLKRELDVGW